MNRGQSKRSPYWNRGRQKGHWRQQNVVRSNVVGNICEFQDKIHVSKNCLSKSPSSSANACDVLSQVNDIEVKAVNFSPQSGPYAGWKLYITDESYEENSETIRKLKLAQKYCRKLQMELGTESIESKGSFNIELKDLISTDYIKCDWESFPQDLRDSPEKIISYFGLAMHQKITEEICEELAVNISFSDKDSNNNTEPVQCNIPKIHARFVGFEPLTSLKQIKAATFGKYVSVKGTVVRVSNIKPLCAEMAFTCNSCETIQAITQPDGKYTLPMKCIAKGCRSHHFSPLRESTLTKTVDWQNIRLQEIVMDDIRDSGRVPRTIECKLMYDLVDCCVPGDIITISGVIKVTNSQESYFKSSKDKCMFLLYILGNSIVNCRENNITKSTTMSLVGMELNAKDMCAIETIQNEPNLFRLLTASLCPSIFGHEMVKAGLILGLVGGTQKFVDDENRIPIRGDPHILVVGDPGLGKSQMLQACANIVPRGVYVCGNTTTTSGLTVTLTKEGANGEYALEAGALVLADQGCCCIDEFDKMSNQHHALLEAMEQQTISIAKGGMVCSLPARTSILAAANPVGGHYNKAKTVAENLRMGSALLSRFDLVFILLDKPNQELDCKLSKHVIALHSTKHDSNFCKPSEFCGTPVSSLGCHSFDSECSLSTRLKFQCRELDLCDPIPHQLLRKYIAFAREKSKPKLMPAAAQVLQQFYLQLRKNYQTSDCTPITTRQLESMIRLTEARARIELRELCTRQDALDVVELTKYSMVDTYSDQFGLLHFQRSQHGSGMSSRSKAKKFIAGLTAISQKTSNAIFTIQQMKQISNELKLDIPDFESFLSSLNNQGFLLKKGQKVYELQTTDF